MQGYLSFAILGIPVVIYSLITCNSGFCGVIVDDVVSLVPLSDVYTIVNQ